MAKCIPALTSLVDKRCCRRPGEVCFQIDPMGPAMLCLALRPGAEAFACMDHISLGGIRVMAKTIWAVPVLRRELDNIGMVVNPDKPSRRPPKGRAPTADDRVLDKASTSALLKKDG